MSRASKTVTSPECHSPLNRYPSRYFTDCDSGVFIMRMCSGFAGSETSMNSTPLFRCPKNATRPATSMPVASSMQS